MHHDLRNPAVEPPAHAVRNTQVERPVVLFPQPGLQAEIGKDPAHVFLIVGTHAQIISAARNGHDGLLEIPGDITLIIYHFRSEGEPVGNGIAQTRPVTVDTAGTRIKVVDVAYLLPDIGTLFRLGDTVPHTAERRDAHRETEALGNGKLQSYFAYIKCIVTALRILRPQIIVLSVKTDLKERRLPVDSAVRSGVEGVYRYRRPKSESYAAHGTRKRRALRHDVAYAVIGIR